MTAQTLRIGKVGRPHGIRGELRIFTDDPMSESLAECDELWIGFEGAAPRKWKIEGARPQQRFWLVRLEGCRSRNDAEALKGAICYVDRDALPDVDGGWYADDLVGLEVRNEAGDALGSVAWVFSNGEDDVIVYRTPDNSEEMVLLHDEFIGDVDVDAGFLVVLAFEVV